MANQRALRFLICRLSAVGDCIHTMPVACALRDAYPDCEINWVVQGGAAALIEPHPCVDRAIVIERRWWRSPKRVLQLRRQLQELKIDWAFDPQSLTKSAALAWLSGAARRVGFARPQGREAAPWLNTVREVKTESHVVDAYLQVLAPLGITSPTVRFDVPQDAQAVQHVEQYLSSIPGSGKFAVINPGAGWGSKLWPAERFAEVARWLGQNCKLRSVVVWAGSREHEWAQQIAQQSDGHAHCAPPTTLPELTEVARRGRMFVGSDTGPMHLAAAVGTACVGLYGPTLPSQCGPYGPQHRSVQVVYQDGSSRERRGEDNWAMRAISVSDVCNACEELLSAPAAGLEAA